MKTYFAAVALSAALAQPVAAETFSTLTTIYVGTGVLDDGSADHTGRATTFFCSNVSGQAASLRVLLLTSSGAFLDSAQTNVAHGATQLFSTHGTLLQEIDMSSGGVAGVVNIESTQSGVFCRAALVDAAAPFADSSAIELVRVNPHIGTVE